jgi:membrane protein DedA with SNARE-associated domain
MVLVGRCIPIVRSLISIPAGMGRMNMVQFLVLTAIGSAAWTSLLAVSGMLLGANWENVLVWLKQYERIVLVVLALIVVVGGWRWYVSRRAALSSPAPSV